LILFEFFQSKSMSLFLLSDTLTMIVIMNILCENLNCLFNTPQHIAHSLLLTACYDQRKW
jgi:hypothetical protein